MTQTEPTITVVAGLIQRDRTWLICQRRHDGAFPLKWEFPGGKVEPGETYQDSLRRELREELGIEAKIGPEWYRTCHAYPGTYTVNLIFYHVPAFCGTLQNYAFEQVRWETATRLAEFEFLEGDAELIRLMRQGKLPPARPY